MSGSKSAELGPVVSELERVQRKAGALTDAVKAFARRAEGVEHKRLGELVEDARRCVREAAAEGEAALGKARG